LTPEEVSEKLQLGVETIYRWLRSGKLRGSRISHKAWRITERELASFMKRQNVSELLFEEYVTEFGLGPVDHEPPFPGTTKVIDYRLKHKGQTLWFEVKEFADDLGLPGRAGGSFDPYIGVRSKINKASEKFRDYDGECCTLVLFNERANLVDICTPRIVLGAMLGNVGFSIPINLETGEEAGPITNVFTTGGKLLHPHIKKPQNTTISAIIALERFPIGRKEFQMSVAQTELVEERRLSWEELLGRLEAEHIAYERRVLRTIVYENPHAANPLPSDIFTGPFDERWGQAGDFIAPIYTGTDLAKLRQAEHELELDIGPLQRKRTKRT